MNIVWKPLLLLVSVQLVTCDNERDSFDPTSQVIILNDSNFLNITSIGDSSNFIKPWFIMFYASWCPHCKRIITLWEEIAQKYSEYVNIGAIECEDNPDTRDLISVQGFPSLLYFPGNNKMYKYKDFRNKENISAFIDTEGWNQLEGEDIPTEINIWKRYARTILSPPVIITFFVGAIAILLIWITLEERNNDKKRSAVNKESQDQNTIKRD